MIRSKSLKRSITASVVAGAVVLGGMVFQPVTVQAEGDGEDGHIIPHAIGKLNITGGITAILQGTSGIANNGDVTDLSYSFDLGLEAAISEKGKVVIALEAGDGEGVNENVPSLSVSNYDAANTITIEGNVVPSVAQIYYEGEYYDGLLGVAVGKLDVHSMYDENAYANDETDQFVSAIFTRYPGSLFTELDNYYAPGIALTVNPSDMFELKLIGANGNDSGFENIFENGFVAGAVNVMPKLMGREGNYRVHVIYDARNYTDISDASKTHETNTGYGLSFDQEIADGIGLFARYGIMDDGIDENLVKSALSGGVSLSGSLWNRENDVIGIAAGILAINEDSSLVAANPDDEGHFEVYYKFGFSDHFTLTPDIQIVTNAGGDADNDTITVYGVRAQMNF